PHDVVRDDIHASFAQAASPVSGAGTDFDQRSVPGETVEGRIAGHAERVLVGEVLSELPLVVWFALPARNTQAIRSRPLLEVWIPGHDKMLENRTGASM